LAKFSIEIVTFKTYSSSNNAMPKKLKVLVIGGRGFVGTAICQALKRHDVYTFDRHHGGRKHTMGSISDLHQLADAINGKDVVINLVGLNPRIYHSSKDYHRFHVDGVRNVVVSCHSMKVKRLIHMSALGADSTSSINFIKTKGLGEEIALESGLDVTVICPSVIFDKDNELFRYLKSLSWTRCFPKIPAKIQPVYRKDVALLFSMIVDKKIKQKKLEVAGPEVMTLFDLAKTVYGKTGKRCFGIPLFLVKPFMMLFSLVHLFGISKDQIRSLNLESTTDSILVSKYITLTRFSEWIKRVTL